MPLTFLDIQGTAAKDLSPLADMPLVELRFNVKNIDRGLDVLKGMQSLTKLAPEGYPTISPADFWRRYDAGEFKK